MDANDASGGARDDAQGPSLVVGDGASSHASSGVQLDFPAIQQAGISDNTGNANGDGDGGGAADSHHQNQQRRRARIRFSCTTCRVKKLKCNRAIPCDQCEKRGISATCHYVPYTHPRQDDSPDRPLQNLPSLPCLSPQNPLFLRPQPLPLPPPPPLPLANDHQQRHSRHPRPSTLTIDQPSRSEDQALHPRHATKDVQRQLQIDAISSTSSAKDRLRHLEHLATLLKSRVAEVSSAEVSSAEVFSANSNNDATQYQPSSAPFPQVPPDQAGPLEAAGRNVDDSYYADAANWEGTHDDIVKLTENLVMAGDEDEDGQPTTDNWDLGPPSDGPVLLAGAFPRVSVHEVFRHLPRRLLVDVMIKRFFEGKEPAWIMFHQPTFYKQYEAFWQAPQSASYSYLALLFMMLAHAAIFCLRGDEPLPDELGQALEVIDGCRNRAAHCLALDDYTKPGRFKVEAMTLYFGTEYLRQTDAPLATAMVLSITLRLAIHMGYHRDPKHSQALTPYEGEMRRRTWAILTEIDKVVSFEFGLPANTRLEDWDTALPRNLYDEDLDEDMDDLPPSRPETERTPVLYAICKARIMVVFGDIITRMSTYVSRYDDVLALDRRLNAAHDKLAEPLRYRPLSQAPNEPVELLMQRYLLELLYQKARCVLHRRFLGVARTCDRYAYSRWVCIDAATKILLHQYDIFVEMLPEGRFSRDRWFLTSTSTHDFLLADMVLCLEISHHSTRPSREMDFMGSGSASSQSQEEPVDRGTSLDIVPEEQLVSLLRTSRSVWETQRQESAEANRAFKILSRMLVISAGGAYDSSPESTCGVATERESLGAQQTSSPTTNAVGVPAYTGSASSVASLKQYTPGDSTAVFSQSVCGSDRGLPEVPWSSTSVNAMSMAKTNVLETTVVAGVLSPAPDFPVPPLKPDLPTMPDLPSLPVLPELPGSHITTLRGAAALDAVATANPTSPGTTTKPMTGTSVTSAVDDLPMEYETGEPSAMPAFDSVDSISDPSFVANWPLWDNQIQRGNIDAVQITCKDFFAPREEE